MAEMPSELAVLEKDVLPKELGMRNLEMLMDKSSHISFLSSGLLTSSLMTSSTQFSFTIPSHQHLFLLPAHDHRQVIT